MVEFLLTMTSESPAIEVEVVEIDGAVPTATFAGAEASPVRPAWQDWQGRVRTLDRRWWPLWVVLGAIVIVLLLTVGLLLGIVIGFFRLVRGGLRAIFR